MSECDSCKNKKNWLCPDSCGYMGACDGWEPKPMTNSDRIRSMSDEELAEMIGDYIDCAICKHHAGTEICPAIQSDCYKKWLDWLRQEADE